MDIMVNMISEFSAASSDDYYHANGEPPVEEGEGPDEVGIVEVVTEKIAVIKVLPGVLTVEPIDDTQVRIRFSTSAKNRRAFEWLRRQVIAALPGFVVTSDLMHASAVLVSEAPGS